jgi:hypothetical protein
MDRRRVLPRLPVVLRVGGDIVIDVGDAAALFPGLASDSDALSLMIGEAIEASILRRL